MGDRAGPGWHGARVCPVCQRQFGRSGQMAENGAAPRVHGRAEHLSTVGDFLFQITAVNFTSWGRPSLRLSSSHRVPFPANGRETNGGMVTQEKSGSLSRWSLGSLQGVH